MSPHGIAGSPEKSSRNSGNKCQLARPPNAAKFYRARLNGVREKRYNFFTPFTILAPQGDPLGKRSPIWVVMYSWAPSINKLLNFVLFQQPVYEISATKVRRFR